MTDYDYSKLDPNYANEFSESGLWDKVTEVVQKVGAGVIYEAMQLFYVAQSADCPMKVKAAVYATLGYFIFPLDIIPDVMPVVGFTDDIGAIGAALAMAHMYIDRSVTQKAKDMMCRLFGKNILKKI